MLLALTQNRRSAHRPVLVPICRLSACGASTAQPQCGVPIDPKTSISIKLHSEHDTVALGSPVLVDITLTNTSKRDITIWRAPGFDYGIDVRDKDNALATDTELGRYRNGRTDFSKLKPGEIKPQYLSGSGACVTLKPGETISDELDIGRYYKLGEGKYSVQVEHRDTASSDKVKSNKVNITITASQAQ